MVVVIHADLHVGAPVLERARMPAQVLAWGHAKVNVLILVVIRVRTQVK